MNQQLQITGNQGTILQHLQLYAPDERRKELSLSFSRSREVPISWRKIVKTSAGPAPYEPSANAIEPFRAFFAEHWGLSDPERPTQAELDRVAREFVTFESPQVWKVTTTSRTETGGKAQVYQLVARQGAVFTNADFDTPSNFAAFWPKIDRVQVPSDVKTEMEVMDLSPGVIWRQYKELKELRTLGDVISTQAEELAKAAVKEGFLNPDQLRTLIWQYLGMKAIKGDVEEKLLRLQDQAEDLGYVLNVGSTDQVFKFPDGSTQTVKPGELYQPYKKVLTWQTTHSRRELHVSWGWFGPRIGFRNVTYTLTHSESVVYYKMMVIDFDPWVEKERQLTELGFKSYRFERFGGTYRTPSGVTLQEVLTLCDRDKQFWTKCVVWIPIYDQKLTEGEVLVKYLIISRPVRGVEVSHLPRLFIEESLSVRRSAAVKVELGELAHTINLAPGEKRTITIDRAKTTEREDRRTAKSLVDLVETESTDFSTELEKETRKETEKSNSTNWSVKASGSWGPASASGSAGGTSSTKTKDFARNLEKIAQKAARSVTRKTQEEISTTTSTKTTVTSSDRNVIEIQNINAGRSLNLAFYRLNNVSSVGLYLDGIELVVLPGVEAVAGSGIILPEVYRLSELPEALSRLSLNAMPVRATTDPKVARRTYGRQLLLDLIGSLEEDYVAPSPQGGSLLLVDVQLADDIATIKRDVTAYDSTQDADDSKLFALVTRLQVFLESARVNQEAIGGEKELVSGSAGFYLDTYVGVREGTEPYAEEARRLELRMKSAETAEILSRAAAFHRAIPLPGGGGLTGRAIDEKTVELTYTANFQRGVWTIYADGVPVGQYDITTNSKTHRFTFQETQSWLAGAEKNVVHMAHESGTILVCLV